MRISLQSTNFCGIEHVDITFSKPLSCILGGNGAGKTSVLDAIRDVLGSPVREIKQKYRKGLLRTGADKFSNVLTLDDKILKSSTSKIPPMAEVEAVIPVSRKAMPFALDSSKFIGATAAELKDLFSEVLNLDVDWKAVAIKEYGCSEQHVALLERDLDAALKTAKANQKATKKGTAPKPPQDFTVTLQAGDTPVSKVELASIDAAIAGVEKQLRAAIEKNAEAKTSHVSDKNRADMKKDIAAMEAKIKSAPDRKKITAELKSAKDSLAQLTADYDKITARQDANEEMQKANKISLALLCKVCKPKIEDSLGIDEKLVADLEKRMAAYIPKITAIQTKVNELTKTLEGANDVPVLESQVKTLKEQLAAPVDDTDVAKLAKEVPMLEEHIKGGRELRETIAAYHRAAEQYSKDLKTYEQSSSAKDGWSEIVKALPKIQKEAVTSGLTPLREIFTRFTFLDGKITVSEDLEISYDGRPYSLMSTSEQYRMSIIQYLAVVEMFQFPFALIDGGEVLVTPTFKAQLLADLRQVAKARPVIYVLSKNDVEIDTMVKSLIDGAITDIGVFKMANGLIEELV